MERMGDTSPWTYTRPNQSLSLQSLQHNLLHITLPDQRPQSEPVGQPRECPCMLCEKGTPLILLANAPKPSWTAITKVIFYVLHAGQECAREDYILVSKYVYPFVLQHWDLLSIPNKGISKEDNPRWTKAILDALCKGSHFFESGKHVMGNALGWWRLLPKERDSDPWKLDVLSPLVLQSYGSPLGSPLHSPRSSPKSSPRSSPRPTSSHPSPRASPHPYHPLRAANQRRYSDTVIPSPLKEDYTISTNGLGASEPVIFRGSPKENRMWFPVHGPEQMPSKRMRSVSCVEGSLSNQRTVDLDHIMSDMIPKCVPEEEEEMLFAMRD